MAIINTNLGNASVLSGLLNQTDVMPKNPLVGMAPPVDTIQPVNPILSPTGVAPDVTPLATVGGAPVAPTGSTGVPVLDATRALPTGSTVTAPVLDASGTDLNTVDFGQQSPLAALFPDRFGGLQSAGFQERLTSNQQAANLQQARLEEAGIAQEQGFGEALQTLDPFSVIGQRGLEQAGFLGDPQAQFEFLQNNPLFQASLENANRATSSAAAAQGRLASGDTLQQLSQNTLLAAQPLLQAQRQDIMSQLGFGRGVASEIANLQAERGLSAGDILGQIGDVQASGIIGFQNREDAREAARQQRRSSNIGAIAGLAAAIFSDERLKENIVKIGKIGEFNKYRWSWNDAAAKLGLFGFSEGVLAQEVEAVKPELIVEHESGFKKVNYGGLI